MTHHPQDSTIAAATAKPPATAHKNQRKARWKVKPAVICDQVCEMQKRDEFPTISIG